MRGKKCEGKNAKEKAKKVSVTFFCRHLSLMDNFGN